MNKTVIITGASGYVGSYTYKTLDEEGFNLVGTYHNTRLFEDIVQVDLTDKKQVKNLINTQNPDLIIHMAADAHSKTCEDDPDNAQRLNVDATKYIVDTAKEKNIRVIYLSTFACYNPSNVYGNTKYEAERIVETLNNYLILRASLIIGVSPNRKNKNYFNDLLDAIEKREDFEADSSWQFEVTCLHHLTEVIKKAIKNPDIRNQIIPVIVKGLTSRLGVAKHLASDIINIKEIDQNRVIPQPELDMSAYEKYSLPRPMLEECFGRIKQNIQGNA